MFFPASGSMGYDVRITCRDKEDGASVLQQGQVVAAPTKQYSKIHHVSVVRALKVPCWQSRHSNIHSFQI
jgi:hypothetical protein